MYVNLEIQNYSKTFNYCVFTFYQAIAVSQGHFKSLRLKYLVFSKSTKVVYLPQK